MITFGIVSSKKSCEHLNQVILSIRNMNISLSNYEILLVGDAVVPPQPNCRHIYFDEGERQGWITRKKNIITQCAKYENIVYLHDYISFSPDWFRQFYEDGFNFDIATCVINNLDGSRFRDWCLWVDNNFPFDTFLQRTRQGLLPYSVTNLSKYMYISGAFWVAKKRFMEKYPLNENLLWGQAEDVEWSKKFRDCTAISLKANSSVRLLKQKPVEFIEVEESLLKAIQYFAETGKLKYLDLINDPFGDLKGS